MYSRRNTPRRPKLPSIKQNCRFKHFRSEIYNYAFDLRSGHFHRWGKDGRDDIPWSPYGPETLTVEISAGAGCPMHCAHCYKKENTTGDSPKNMSFETFKSIFDRLPCVIGKKSNEPLYFTTQINFEITSVNTHPEIWDIFDYCREYGVIPNITLNGADPMTDFTLMRVVDTCGIINVTVNVTNFQHACNQIQRMTKYGAGRVNIHFVVNTQAINFLYDTLLPAIKEDIRLRGLHDIHFLGLKPINRGANFDSLSSGEYIRLLNYCVKKKILFSYDTCSASHFEKAIDFLGLSPLEKKSLMENSKRCEAGLFSGHVDIQGRWWHCSFGQGIDEAGGFVDLTKIKDFYKEVWQSEPMKKWRRGVVQNNRECTLFPELNVFPSEQAKIIKIA